MLNYVISERNTEVKFSNQFFSNFIVFFFFSEIMINF